MDLRTLAREAFHAAARAAREIADSYLAVGSVPGIEPPKPSPDTLSRRLLSLTPTVALGDALDDIRFGNTPVEGLRRTESRLYPNPFELRGAPFWLDLGMGAIFWFWFKKDVFEHPETLSRNEEALAEEFVAAFERDRTTEHILAFLLGVRVSSPLPPAKTWRIRPATPEDTAKLEFVGQAPMPPDVYLRMAILEVAEDRRSAEASIFDVDKVRTRLRGKLNTLRLFLALQPDLEIEQNLVIAYDDSALSWPGCDLIDRTETLVDEAEELVGGWEPGEVDPDDDGQLSMLLDQLLRKEVPHVELDAGRFRQIVGHVDACKEMTRAWPKGARRHERLWIALDRLSRATERLGVRTRSSERRKRPFESMGRSPIRNRRLEETVLLDLVIALEAVMGADDQSGEQDRLKRRAVQLLSSDFDDPARIWTDLREMWKARNVIMHGDPLADDDLPDSYTQLRRLRSLVAWTIVRTLEVYSVDAADRPKDAKKGLNRVYEIVDLASIDPAQKVRLDAMRHPGVCRPGTFTTEYA